MIAELCHFVSTLGRDECERRIGRRMNKQFFRECLDVRSLSNRRPFDVRVSPTSELDRALAMLWS